VGIRYFVLPQRSQLAKAERVHASSGACAEIPPGISVWYNPGHSPRAWIVHQVEVLPPLETESPRSVRRRTAEALLIDGRVRDLRSTAVVETDVPLDPLPAVSPADEHGANPDGGAREEERCRVVHHDPLSVVIEVWLAESGLVVLADQFYPGWTLEVTSLDTRGRAGQGRSWHAPILRTNRVMR
jgi:hypothetical protein